MATSTANRGGAGGDGTGSGVAKLDDNPPATITPPEAVGSGVVGGIGSGSSTAGGLGMGMAKSLSGVGMGMGMGSSSSMGVDMNEIFQWKRTRSSWRLAAAGIGGGSSSAAAAPSRPAVSGNGGIGGMTSPTPPGPLSLPGGVSAGTGPGSGPGPSSGTTGGGVAPLINAQQHHRQQQQQQHHHHQYQHHQHQHQHQQHQHTTPVAGSLSVVGAAGGHAAASTVPAGQAAAAAVAAIERPLHTVLGPGRITKIRHRPSTAASLISSTSSAAITLKKSLGSTSSSMSPSAAAATITAAALSASTSSSTIAAATTPTGNAHMNAHAHTHAHAHAHAHHHHHTRAHTRGASSSSSNNSSSNRHHYLSSPAKANSTINANANANANAASNLNSTTTAANSNNSAAAAPQKTLSTLDLIEMENPVLSFWGPDLVPLPSRFARIKRNLIAGHEAALEASWARLIAALGAEVEHIEGLGSHLIPSIEFSDLDDGAQTTRFGRDLKRYGIGVVRGVVPRPDADDAVRETVRYIQKNHDSKPPPLPQDPTCYDFFWTPAQVRTRAHPSVLRAQRFMMGLWSTAADDRLVTKYPIAYADRIRIHAPPMASSPPSSSSPSSSSASSTANPPPGSGSSTAGPHGNSAGPGPDPGPASSTTTTTTTTRPSPPHRRSENGLPGPPVRPPKSADDWLNAIQSSGVIAQVDNGSLERWEPDGYQRGGTYNPIFHGDWEEYDPWEVAGRATTTSDLYNGYAACSIFRMFSGLVALSTIEPGMIRLLPSPKLVTAYFLLRPFFSPRNPPPPPEVRQGPEWDAFLAADNWALDREPNSYIHGAVPGHAQRVTELWHPHLQLRRSMITLPTLQSGDYILWHPDLAYHITSDGTGLRSPIYGSPDEVSVLVYVPAAPLTQTNALYLARQRKAFLRGQPGPDFDSAGIGLDSEAPQDSRLGEEHVSAIGGEGGLQAMGLAMYDGPDAQTPEEKDAEPGRMDIDAETKSLSSTSSASHAEAEVIRLANIILFPDKAMMGFP